MELFYDLFQASAISAPAAGRMSKLRIHQVLVQAQTIQLFPIGGFQAKVNLIYNDYTAPKNRWNPINLQLATSESPSIFHWMLGNFGLVKRSSQKDGPASKLCHPILQGRFFGRLFSLPPPMAL